MFATLREETITFVLPVRPSTYNDLSYNALNLYNFISGACERPEKDYVDVSYSPKVSVINPMASILPRFVISNIIHHQQYTCCWAVPSGIFTKEAPIENLSINHLKLTSQTSSILLSVKQRPVVA